VLRSEKHTSGSVRPGRLNSVSNTGTGCDPNGGKAGRIAGMSLDLGFDLDMDVSLPGEQQQAFRS
jgi:hypothetical protein